MAAWTTVTDAVLTAGNPVKATTMRQLRDNVTAMAEGATGAPAISPEKYQGRAIIAGDASVDFTLAAGDEQIFRFRGVIPASDARNFRLYASDDNKATFENITDSNANTFGYVTPNGAGSRVGSAPTEYGIQGEVVLSQIIGDYPIGTFSMSFWDSSGSIQQITIGFSVLTTAPLTDIRFGFDSGNLESGEIYYSIRNHT